MLCLSHQSQPPSLHDHKNITWWTEVMKLFIMWNSESSYLVTSCPQSICSTLRVRDQVWHIILKLTVTYWKQNNSISTVQHNEMSSPKSIKFHASPSGGSRIMGDLQRRWTKIKWSKVIHDGFYTTCNNKILFSRGTHMTSATHT